MSLVVTERVRCDVCCTEIPAGRRWPYARVAVDVSAVGRVDVDVDVCDGCARSRTILELKIAASQVAAGGGSRRGEGSL